MKRKKKKRVLTWYHLPTVSPSHPGMQEWAEGTSPYTLLYLLLWQTDRSYPASPHP